MTNISIVEKHPGLKRSSIAIRAYFDPFIENMGLQKYGMTLFDGVLHEEPLACLEINGQKRYLTGLNKPDNDDLWGNIYLRCGNDPVFLEPDQDPYDLIKLCAIEAGGFSMIAKSLEDARSRPSAPKFYLDKQEDTAALVTEVKKIKAKAMGELQKIYDKHQSKMFLVAKVLDVNSMQYKKSTPNDVLYDNLFEYIEGNRSDKDKRKCAGRFLDVVTLDMETLKIRAIIKDSTYLKLIHTKSDGYIYHVMSGTLMGKNPTECLEFLKNPLHEDVLKILTTEVEKYWNL
jgi:hypothetical protein